ncbi:hypothetical protein PFISCL1PPCAC_17915, partial [Pristionchus fissidentatus]
AEPMSNDFLKIPPGAQMEQIGQGGQAVVYSCSLEIDGVNRKVAIKSYGADCSMDELETLRRLDHPNIVTFFGLVKLNGRQALVLE